MAFPNPWIKFDDEKPDEQKVVLVKLRYHQHPEFNARIFYKGEWYDTRGNSTRNLQNVEEDVEYWMPFPGYPDVHSSYNLDWEGLRVRLRG